MTKILKILTSQKVTLLCLMLLSEYSHTQKVHQFLHGLAAFAESIHNLFGLIFLLLLLQHQQLIVKVILFFCSFDSPVSIFAIPASMVVIAFVLAILEILHCINLNFSKYIH